MLEGGLPRVFVNEVLDVTGDSHRLLEEECQVTYGRAMWDEPGRPMTEDELIEACYAVRAVMGASRDRYTRRFMEACPQLEMVSKYGIGTDKIDVVAASELGILVGHTPVPENYESVAEHSIALMLAVLRRLAPMESHLRKGGWRGPETVLESIAHKTIGLIGLGRIGQEVAKRLSGWQVRILAHDPYQSQTTAEEVGAELVDLEELLGQADVVSVHAVVTPETRGLLGAKAFSMMKPTAYVINTARGELIDEVALYDALVENRLAGAALDVLCDEPPGLDNPLLQLDSVLATPHVASLTTQGTRAITMAATRNVLAALHGELPLYLKNPDVVDAWLARRSRSGLPMPELEM